MRLPRGRLAKGFFSIVSLCVVLIMAGCSGDDNDTESGAVYAMTNALRTNEIVVFRRASNGTLTFMQRIATGGGGSGIQLDPTDSLGSQGGVVLNQSHTLLFAVNTESLAEDPRDGTDIGDCQR